MALTPTKNAWNIQWSVTNYGMKHRRTTGLANIGSFDY